MLEILARSFGMPYGGIHFFTNPMLTYCLSVNLSVEYITNFRRSFLYNYSAQVLEILAYALI
jgi:hypothetical protein